MWIVVIVFSDFINGGQFLMLSQHYVLGNILSQYSKDSIVIQDYQVLVSTALLDLGRHGAG